MAGPGCYARVFRAHFSVRERRSKKFALVEKKKEPGERYVYSNNTLSFSLREAKQSGRRTMADNLNRSKLFGLSLSLSVCLPGRISGRKDTSSLLRPYDAQTLLFGLVSTKKGRTAILSINAHDCFLLLLLLLLLPSQLIAAAVPSTGLLLFLMTYTAQLLSCVLIPLYVVAVIVVVSI